MGRKKKQNYIPLKDVEKVEIWHHTHIGPKISLKVSPLALINIYDGYSVRAGLEAKLFRNLSLNVELGKYIAPFGRSGPGNGKGYTFNPELRIYFNHNQRTAGTYMALGYFYKDHTSFWGDSIYVNNSTVMRDYDVTSKSHIAQLKLGFTRMISSHWMLDFFVGLGYEDRTTTTTLSKTEQNAIVPDDEKGFYESKMASGHFQHPSFHAGFKIGWRIW